MAFKKWQRSPSRKPPEKTWTEDEMKIIGWCITRNIKISMVPDWKNDISKWLIDISINGKIHTDPSKYSDDNIHNKILEYYKYYYKPNTNDNG
tara:strand:- start:282 stop:560 length:279 start_codon:yes stop_codon:yes gene_type:complete